MRRRLLGPAVTLVATLLALLAGELSFRAHRGYELWTWRLEPRARRPGGGGPDAAELSRLLADFRMGTPQRADLDFDWFFLEAPPLPERASDSEFEERRRLHPYDWVNYVFNVEYVRVGAASPARLATELRRLELPWVLVAPPPPGGGIHPGYRYPASVRLPSGLSLNAFGYRGPEIALARPAGTVRIACVGASTTVGSHHYAASYPELLAVFLGAWASARGQSLRFEVLNAGREGALPADVAAILRHELLPFDPDLVVHYEGANAFRPETVLRWEGGGRFGEPPDSGPEAARASHSAILEALRSAARPREGTGEPTKPGQRVEFPPGLSETAPALGPARAVLGLDLVLDGLDSMREAASSRGCLLVLGSFAWLATEELRLVPGRHDGIHAHLNQALWPISYGNLRRLADFHNRVIRTYAAAHDLPFIDVAGRLPTHPELYIDAIHHSPHGVRALAWAVFEGLIPILDAELAAGRLPRPPVPGPAVHPYLVAPSRMPLPR
jgi:hypothetical protein